MCDNPQLTMLISGIRIFRSRICPIQNFLDTFPGMILLTSGGPRLQEERPNLPLPQNAVILHLQSSLKARGSAPSLTALCRRSLLG